MSVEILREQVEKVLEYVTITLDEAKAVLAEIDRARAIRNVYRVERDEACASLAAAEADREKYRTWYEDKCATANELEEALHGVREALAAAEARADRYRKALVEIKDKQGKVCSRFEVCGHVACRSSYTSWAIADAALAQTATRAVLSTNNDPERDALDMG